MSTLRLILTRHAKSSWGQHGLADHERPLNARGRQSAVAIGNWLRAGGHVPDQILSSSAERTRETARLLGFDIEPEFSRFLYLADADTMLQTLHGASGATVLMIGHNPGIAELAEELVAMPPAHPRFSDYPTCATLIAEFSSVSWAEIQPGGGRVVDFITPRELTDG